VERAALSDQVRAEWDIYYKLDALLEKHFGRSGGPRLVSSLYNELIQNIFVHTIRFGTFRLPNKLGVFRLVRRRPSYWQLKRHGKEGRRPPSVDLKYLEGEAVLLALGRLAKGRSKVPPRLVRETRRLGREQVAGLVAVSSRELQQFLRQVNKETNDE
jgi:hypothetical protein